jgi:RNA polymerase sigma-70 factor (ECF subfamily)
VSKPPAEYERADEADGEVTASESGPASVPPGHRPGPGPWPGEPGASGHSTLGTRSEFAEVYNEHSRAIFYLALRLLGDPQKAEDATHDVFLKAFRKMDQFRRESTWRTWLYRIAINHCRNLQQAWHDRHLFTNADDALWETTAARTDSPLRVLEIKELGQRIQKTLDRLPAEYRLLLLLVADEQLSYAEVGALTDQTPDAVRGKLHRARKAFALLFDKSA